MAVSPSTSLTLLSGSTSAPSSPLDLLRQQSSCPGSCGPWVLCPLGLMPPLTDKGVCKAKVSNPLTVPACPLDLRIPHPNGPGACAGPLSGPVLSRDTAELRPERGRVALFLWGAAGARPCPLVWACNPRGPSGCAEQVVGRNGPGGGPCPHTAFRAELQGA